MERRGGVEAAPGGGEGEMEATGSERRGEVRPPDPDLDRGREEGRAVVGRGREEWGEWEWGLGFLGCGWPIGQGAAGWAVGRASPFGRLRPAGPLGPAGGCPVFYFPFFIYFLVSFYV